MAEFLMGWGASAWAQARERGAGSGWCWHAHEPAAGAVMLAFREGAAPFDGGWFVDDTLALAWVGDWRNAADYPRARLGTRRQAGGNARLAALLATLWTERGEAMFDALHGVLACVVWERRARRLWLVRDKLGLVPLVFAPAGCGGEDERGLERGLLVSSDADWLADVSGKPPRPNLARLRRFMLGAPDTGSDDFVEGHYRVRPRERVKFVAPDLPEHKTYWRPDTTSRHDTHSFDHELRDTLEEVLRSVARGPHGMAPASRRAGAREVRPGVEMSGGLDSTAIAALLTDLARRTPAAARGEAMTEPIALSMVAPGLPDSDESREIAEVAEHLRIRAHAFSIAEHWPLRDLQVFATRPMLGPHLHAEEHYIEQFHRFAQSAAPVTRLLNGVGADQIFSCAPVWYGRRLWETGALTELLAVWASRDPRWFDTRFAVSCLLDVLALKPVARRLDAAVRGAPRQRTWYDPRNWVLDADRPTGAAVSRPAARSWSQFQLEAVDDWAWELDRRTLYREAARVQLELVSPMFDDRLWELCLRMPAEYVMARGVEKAPLRRVVRGLLPPATVERRKFASFAQIVQRGLTREAHRVHAWFGSSRLEELGLISAAAYRQAFERFCDDARRERSSRSYPALYPLWTTLSAECWLKLFSDRGCDSSRACVQPAPDTA